MLLRAFFESQFSHWTLIWMFHSRTFNNNIYRLDEKALRIVYDDCSFKFDSFSTHHRSIQTLTIEIFKFLNGLFPQIIMKSSRLNRHPRTIWGIEIIYLVEVPKQPGTESILFMSPKIWSIVSQELKNYQSLYSLK